MHLLRTLQQLSNAFTIKIKIFIRVNKTLQDMATSPLFSSQAIFTLTYLTLGMLSFSLFPLLSFPGLPVLDSMTLHQNGLSQPPPRLEPPINFHKYLVFFSSITLTTIVISCVIICLMAMPTRLKSSLNFILFSSHCRIQQYVLF